MLFFEKILLDENGLNAKFIALENEVSIGECKLKIENDQAEIFDLSFNSDKPFTVEGLVKSALNYACYKNIYMAKCKQMNIEKFLVQMKFEKKDEYYQSDIPTVLMGSCCKNM